MRDTAAFEARLAEAFDRYAAVAPVAVDARALTRSLAAAHAARPTLGDRLAAAFGVRRAAPVLLLLLLAVAAVAVGALALRLLDRPARVFGAFEPLPAIGIDVEEAAPLPDGRVLVLGQGGMSEQEARVVDPDARFPEEVGSLHPGRFGASLVPLRDGRVLVVGGYTNVTAADGTETSPDVLVAQVFDPATGQFTDAGAMTRARRDPATAVLRDGRVLVVGGVPAGPESGPEDTPPVPAEIFDPATGTFATTGTPTAAREGTAVVTLDDGRVLLAGGSLLDPEVGWRPAAMAEIFDPATGAFAPTGSMREPRVGHSLTALSDGRILVVGGMNETGDLATAELYDPDVGAFSPAASLATERTDHVATLLPSGEVLVTGGSNRFGLPRTAELFDPRSGRWERAGTAAVSHAFARLQPDATVLLVGGGAPERWRAIAPVAPVAAPTPGAGFAAAGSPHVQRTGHTATRLRDGRVLLTGGRSQDPLADQSPGALRSAEVFDPTTGTFVAVDAMSQARVDHAAALLPDGRVLVVGGDRRPSRWSEENWLTSELFDPATGRFTLLSGRIAWGRTACGVDLAALADGRTVLLADCPTGDAIQAYDAETGWAEPAPVDDLPCYQGPVLPRLHALAVGDRLVVLCPDDVRFGFIVDPATGTATPIETAPGAPPRRAAATDAGLLPDGRLVYATDLDIRAIDLATGRVEVLGPLATQRGAGRLTVLEDGSVLVTGGRATAATASGVGGRPLPDADLWDPAGGTRPAGRMADGRVGHTATLLADGRVLLVGGSERSPDRTDPEPVGAEIFDPALASAGTPSPAP